MARKIVPALYKFLDEARELVQVAHLLAPTRRRHYPKNFAGKVVVSMTSYPARIGHAWRAIETLLRQDISGFQLVLVLSTEEFPGGLLGLPRKIRAQVQRGLDILWVDRNGGSFDKLLPIRQCAPDAIIITVDDDKYFPAYLVRSLMEAHSVRPRHIIAARGWRVLPEPSSGLVKFGKGWLRAQPGDEGSGLHAPGGNGCLYPPQALDPIVDDLELALKLCPTTDDIWFWMAARLAHTPFYCLGFDPHRPVKSQANSFALSSINRDGADYQFQAALKHFELDPTSLMWS